MDFGEAEVSFSWVFFRSQNVVQFLKVFEQFKPFEKKTHSFLLNSTHVFWLQMFSSALDEVMLNGKFLQQFFC